MALAAMNASATPFVPKDDTDTPKDKDKDAPAQGLSDVSGVEVETGGMSGVSVWRPQYKGRIRSFSDQKGFGFIDSAETMRQFGRDVFIHRFQMAEFDLKVGQEVIFEVELNKMGHPQGRRVRPNEEEAMSWGMSQMGGVGGQYEYGSYGMGGGSMYGGGNYYHQGRERYGAPDQSMMMGMAGDTQGPPEQIEELLRGCSGSSDMWEIIEQYGHSFGKKHVVTALYQLGLCRQYEKRSAEVNLTGALVDRLVLFSPSELTADEASRVLWALAILEEVSNHSKAHRFAIELGEQAAKRFSEFTPAQMAGLVSSLSRLVRAPEEDELVGKVTTQFSDYALGGTGALPRFAPHELTPWTNFLKEAANVPGQQQQQPPMGPGGSQGAPYPFMQMPGKGGGGGYGQPGSYSGGPGMMNWGPQMKGMSGGPPMGKGGMNPAGGLAWGQGGGNYPPGKGGGKDGFGQMSADMYAKGNFEAMYGKGAGGKPGMGPGGPMPGSGFGGPDAAAGAGPGARGKGFDLQNYAGQMGGGGKMGGKGGGDPSMGGKGAGGFGGMGPGGGPRGPSYGSPMQPGPVSQGQPRGPSNQQRQQSGTGGGGGGPRPNQQNQQARDKPS